MNPYRCETCKNKDKYGFCKILNYRVISPECVTVQEGFTKRVGCASHSDFQSEREKVLDEVFALLNKLYEQKYDPRPCNRTDDGGMYNDAELDLILEIQKDIESLRQEGKVLK